MSTITYNKCIYKVIQLADNTTQDSLSNYVLKEWGSGGIPVYLECYSTTNFKGLSDWLSRFNKDLAEDVANCGKSWHKFWCDGDGGHLLLRRRLCGHRRFCPNDARSYVNLRVNRAYEVLREFASKLKFKVYLIHIVFTLPQPLWGRAVEDSKLLVDVVYRTLDEYKGMKGGVLSVHFTHSKNPLLGWFPHVHVIMLNVVAKVLPQLSEDGLKPVKRKRDGVVYFVRKRPYLNHLLLKMKYKWWIQKVFGYTWRGLPDVYVNYVKFCDENEGKIKHLLRYAFRLPIQDFYNVDFSNLTEEQSNFVWQLLNLKFKRIRWFGFLADGVKKFYFSFVGLDYVRLEVVLSRIKAKSRICPIHGCEMVYLGVVGGLDPPDVE